MMLERERDALRAELDNYADWLRECNEQMTKAIEARGG
jgi:hypothetical protein